MAGFSLKDHLFNSETIGQLAGEYARGLPGFNPDAFVHKVLGGFETRELLERLEWITDCLEPYLASDFSEMAVQIDAMMPPPLDPALRDDDFGHFIHAVPGILAVRHGIETDPDRALELLENATQRFSMEFYIRPFINRWPDLTLDRLAKWSRHENYHVRRLVSEGTRPRLPWAKSIKLDPLAPLSLLATLHSDDARFVTRSVANHLNDISKLKPDLVVKTLSDWRDLGEQSEKELAWMTRHALRTLIKKGHEGAMHHLGYRPDAPIQVDAFTVASDQVKAGEALKLSAELSSNRNVPVIVDYVVWFNKADGTQSPKVFKWKTTDVVPTKPLELAKSHKLKADATTFKLYPGAHKVCLQVNGKILASQDFTVLAAD